MLFSMCPPELRFVHPTSKCFMFGLRGINTLLILVTKRRHPLTSGFMCCLSSCLMNVLGFLIRWEAEFVCEDDWDIFALLISSGQPNASVVEQCEALTQGNTLFNKNYKMGCHLSLFGLASCQKAEAHVLRHK
jgi:hypothetical protein